MSGLDRAFIKAYTKQHQPASAMGASHVKHAPANRQQPNERSRRSEAAQPYSTSSVSSAAHWEPVTDAAAQRWSAPRSPLPDVPAESAAAASYLIFDGPHTIAEPHWNTAPARTVQDASEAVTTPTPLSTMLAADWAGPAFEAEQFGWASPITDLVTRAGADLDAVAHKILSAARGGGQVIAIASAEPAAGGTTLLLCLAQRLAAMKVRAALVDADFSSPSLAEQLGMSPPFGWEDITENERSLCDVLIESMEDGLALLPLRGPVAVPQRLADDLYWRTTIDALRGRYRLVLLDVGAVDSDEPMDLPWLRPGCGIDAAVVVGRDGEEGRERLTSAVHRLHGADIDVLGVVENFCLPEAQRLARERPRVAAAH